MFLYNIATLTCKIFLFCIVFHVIIPPVFFILPISVMPGISLILYSIILLILFQTASIFSFKPFYPSLIFSLFHHKPWNKSCFFTNSFPTHMHKYNNILIMFLKWTFTFLSKYSSSLPYILESEKVYSFYSLFSTHHWHYLRVPPPPTWQ